MSALQAMGFPETEVRGRAQQGAAAAFPPVECYGREVFGGWSSPAYENTGDSLDHIRLVPPVFTPQRLEKLIALGREPLYTDVDLETAIGSFRSPLPYFICAFGSTEMGGPEIARALSRQAGRLGLPMVIGENVVPVNGYAAGEPSSDALSLLFRLRSYLEEVPDGWGGVVVQQSTEDADAEVWNTVYSDPSVRSLLESGRLAFELKIGQGAKPGLGGMTLLDTEDADRLSGQYAVHSMYGDDHGKRLRCSAPGTFTEEIMRQQIRLMRNNYPRAGIWVKLPPSRDIAVAAATAWAAGAEVVTVDGAEGGTGWAPNTFLDQVGLPLAQCLDRIGIRKDCLLASGRIWEGGRAVKCMALGARAVGLGRAALIATDEDRDHGLTRLVEALDMESRMLISALGKYRADALAPEDVWVPANAGYQPRIASVVNGQKGAPDDKQ
ncbi:glutamate synthase-related protein [Streptomyces sp. NPDC098077]|uniref:glutamate synthase-related protein n=1 Tax=Streptomyces sp. NPDC098077 TaxID=3366093 RepID=UPI0037F14595